ncbi:MAG: TolC family protein [Spartobacteria bacterium]|nr:TolC family protein [Spartobacteria bacterium]
MTRIRSYCRPFLGLPLFSALLSGSMIHPAARAESMVQVVPVLSLHECEDLAMAQNHKRPASAFAVAAAEAQHAQAMAGFWPQLSVSGGFTQHDEPYNFLFPAQNMTVAGMAMPVNEYNIKLLDEEIWSAQARAAWLLFDGGMRSGMRMQTEAGLQAAQEAARRTDLEVLDSVRRLYYGAVLAEQLYTTGKDTLDRMEATLHITETMYKEGAGTVKKTDYLSNKVMVETLRAAVATLESNVRLSQAALANTMGMKWSSSVKPADTTIPFVPCHINLNEAAGQAYMFNPDWKSMDAALSAAAGKERTVLSEYYPRVAVQGRVYRWWNDYDAGLDTDENNEGWFIGIGLELPLFEGFLTQNKIKAARARMNELAEQRILLEEGLGLQIRKTLIDLDTAEKRYDATLLALNTATENRDLNMRAYQNDMVETKDVITAQLTEAFMALQHHKMCYDHAVLRSKLNYIIGREIMKRARE